MVWEVSCYVQFHRLFLRCVKSIQEVSCYVQFHRLFFSRCGHNKKSYLAVDQDCACFVVACLTFYLGYCLGSMSCTAGA
jgi:hypothetical protein